MYGFFNINASVEEKQDRFHTLSGVHRSSPKGP
jgi:hypothetical protein